MPVLDSGRMDDYDFSYQRASTCAHYDVLWQVLRLQLTSKDLRKSVSIMKAYTEAALNPNEQVLRFLRVSVWMGVQRAYLFDSATAELWEDYKFEILLDYRNLRADLFPRSKKEPGHGTMNKFLTWDWNIVRNDLRGLFKNNPITFVQMRRNQKPAAHRFLGEERNYFLMLCDEDTYVPRPTETP